MRSFRQILNLAKDRQTAAKSTPHDAASRIAVRTYEYFYSTKNSQWQARVKSHGTLGDTENFGYTVWSVVIATQALAECGLSNYHLRLSLPALQAYWNPQKHAFCAWKYYIANDDIYFDDNAHAANALISVFEVTNDLRYLEQARAILIDFLIPASKTCDGALPWHINDYTKRHACSTGSAAVSALRLYDYEQDHALLAFAEKALLWLSRNLQDPKSGLIWDHLSINSDGAGYIDLWCWSYNTGFVIHGFSLLYKATTQQQYLDDAIRLAEAAMNAENTLIDGQSPSKMYTDGSFFLHHLVDGFLALSQNVMNDRLQNEIKRIAAWGMKWMYDERDGMYFRGSKAYRISEEMTEMFNRKYNTHKDLERNVEERDENGELCKTLLGNAGWVRIFALAQKVGMKETKSNLQERG